MATPVKSSSRSNACLLALSLVLVACTGDARGGQSQSRADWIEKANAVCAEGDRKAHALGEATTLEQLVPVLEGTLRVNRQQLAKLRRLRPEPAEHRALASILDGLDRINVAMVEMLAAARRQNQTDVDAAAARVKTAAERSDRLVAHYGLHECRSDDG